MDFGDRYSTDISSNMSTYIVSLNSPGEIAVGIVMGFGHFTLERPSVMHEGKSRVTVTSTWIPFVRYIFI
ncbi:hypothetical protein DL95DRAFT_381322 [Leptodontidium sp. 2 PMI_412]|nr:hypothetical protein DL95DRAFT_381322 [Leptodontidium sp. 2 PMI_412]